MGRGHYEVMDNKVMERGGERGALRSNGHYAVMGSNGGRGLQSNGAGHYAVMAVHYEVMGSGGITK